jgi:hypothetical protein
MRCPSNAGRALVRTAVDGRHGQLLTMATTTQDPRSLDSELTYELIHPFSEAAFAKPNGFERAAPEPVQWTETVSPFTEAPDRGAMESEGDRLIGEALDELRDESFDEAVANLVEETEQAIGERFANESPSSASERERFADAHLANVRFESHQYLEALETGLQGLDLESFNEQQLDEMLDRLDPNLGELTPAGEEFIGKLVRKAKSAVKFVVKTAKNIGGKIASTVIGPVLKKLRRLINPLLRRVLSFAIGRLPAALQPAARTLAKRFTSETEAEAEAENLADESPMSPANLTDVEALTESFDEALAEAVTNLSPEGLEGESLEAFDQFDTEGAESRQLEALADARGELIDRLAASGDNEDLAPAVEQFVPAILAALRLGINLIGRPKVVGFLAKYIGQLIKRWVGPQLAGPLSNAIVDTGLRLITLEAEAGEAGDSREAAGPVALASVIEDTVRKLAESEDYVFENEDLMQLAAAEAFSQAVATHFPTQFVRPALQQAPSLGGTFVTRRPRSVRRFYKYTRTPDVEVSAQIADAIPTFGGATLGAVLRASGATFPVRARLHIYQAAVGTTVPGMMRVDRRHAGGRRFRRPALAHPLTPAAAGLLLREPGLGVAVPARFMRSRHRIAAGQRFFHLEPTGPASMLALQEAEAPRLAAPTRAWTVINLRKARITVGFHLSETESQTVVTAIRAGRGGAALLQALMAAYKTMDGAGARGRVRARILREEGEDFEDFAANLGKIASGLTGSLRKRLRAWVLPALAAWVRSNAEAFARAAAAPEDGVTIRVRLTGVPGLDLLGRLPDLPKLGMPKIPRGTPSINITVSPGRPKK